jgi:CHAT domain-containing protein
VAFKQVDLKSLNTSLEDLVQTSRDSIGVRGRSIFEVTKPPAPDQTQRLQQLHKLLIESIAQFLPTNPSDRVIFIPQNQLFLVPFPALKDASGKYLIEKHTILTAPAIQVLQLTREKRQSMGNREWKVGSGDVLVVGNPTMPTNLTAPTGELIKLSPLPSAEQEALAIANLLKTKALIGDRATKAVVEQQMAKARIIHLATHGLLDDFKGKDVPGAIALAPEGNDNGLLTAWEIFNMKLNAELVILSACDTGRGGITGDGVIGLSRSLITAGVPSVIVSLWAVPDAPTASLMTQFYQNLQQNPDKAQALRNAMLTTMKQHPNPKNWAAFTLIGEAD